MNDRSAANQERIARLRARAEQHKSGGGGNFWKPTVGTHKVRVLPEVGNMQAYWQEVGTHEVPKRKGADKHLCPAFTSNGAEECPICDYIEQLKADGNKKLANDLRLRKQYRMNVIVRGGKNKEDFGPVLWTPGIQVFEQTTAILNNPDFGDFTDLYEGFDLSVEREGEGLDTEYKVMPRRNPSPVYGTIEEPDEEAIQEAVKKTNDLSEILDKLPSRNELLEAIGLADEDLEDEEVDEEPEAPRSRVRGTPTAKTAASSKAPAKKSRIEYEDEDEADFD